MKQAITTIIEKAIDIHVHIGPEIIPRKFTVDTLLRKEEGKIGGMVLKNHFYPTTSLIESVENRKISLFGGLVLNNAVGGINPEAVYASSLIATNPFIVWFPTINAKHFLDNSTYEIAPEWVQRKNFSARKATDIEPVLLDQLKVRKTLKEILLADAALATGHISWKESVNLITLALKMDLSRIIVTHPIYQRIAMPIAIQIQLAQKGVFLEQSYSMYSIDQIPIAKIAEQIRAVGSQSVILSSDVGQTFSKSPSQALTHFCTLLLKENIKPEELYTMLVVNPRKLLNFNKKDV